MPNFVDDSPPAACLFCRICAGEIPAARVYEDDHVLAFMDVGPVNPGHVLVATKRHAVTLFELTDDEAAQVMRTVRRVALAVREVFSPPGTMLFQANGKEAGQTVFHFHMHVVPRHADDGAGLVWPRGTSTPAELASIAQRVAQKLEG